MGKKFDEIYESVVSRYEVGAGFLPGDVVKFRSNYKTCAAYKAMSTDMQREVDDLANCKLNIMVVQVGDKLSGASAGNQLKTADNAVITISADQGGGRNYGRVTVSPEMIDRAYTDTTNLPPVPDEWKRKDKVNIKPKPVEDFSDADNRKTDKGNGKNTPTDLKLAGESTVMRKDMDNLAAIYEQTIN
jgi:hypothetical protein